MNALVLAVAALLFSRLVAPDRVEPHRKQVISAIEKTTDTLPNSLRLPIIVGGAVSLGAVFAYMPIIGVVVTFCALSSYYSVRTGNRGFQSNTHRTSKRLFFASTN